MHQTAIAELLHRPSIQVFQRTCEHSAQWALLQPRASCFHRRHQRMPNFKAGGLCLHLRPFSARFSFCATFFGARDLITRSLAEFTFLHLAMKADPNLPEMKLLGLALNFGRDTNGRASGWIRERYWTDGFGNGSEQTGGVKRPVSVTVPFFDAADELECRRNWEWENRGRASEGLGLSSPSTRWTWWVSRSKAGRSVPVDSLSIFASRRTEGIRQSQRHCLVLQGAKCIFGWTRKT